MANQQPGQSPYTFTGNPVDYKPPVQAAPQVNTAPVQGPTGFWQRVGTIGIGKVNALNAVRMATRSGPAVQSNNQPLKSVGKKTMELGKGVAKEVTEPFRDVAVRGKKQIEHLTGPTRTEQGKVGGAQIIKDQQVAGKNPQYKALVNKYKDVGSDAIIHANNMVAKGENIGKVEEYLKSSSKAYQKNTKQGVGTAANLTTAVVGGGELKTAIKGGAAVAKQGLKETAKDVLKQGVKNIPKAATLGGVQAAASDVEKEGKTSAKSIATGAVVGAGIGLTAPVLAKGAKTTTEKVSEVFKRGSTERLKNLRGHGPSEMKDVMTPAQADKAAAAAHTDIHVTDKGGNAEQVPVRTPIRPGIKQSSTTYKIGVRTPVRPGIKETLSEYKVDVKTPQKMSDKDYTKRFDEISKSYDAEYKALQNKSPAVQKIQGHAIDTRHQRQLDQLDIDYTNPKPATGPSKVTRVSSTTTPAGKTTGGTPKIVAKRVSSESTPAGKTTGGVQKLKGASISTPKESSITHTTEKSPEVTKTTGTSTVTPVKSQPAAQTIKGQVVSKDNLTARPRETKPEGTKVTSQLSQKINSRAVEHKITEDLGDLAQHEKLDIKAHTARAADMVNNDPDRAVAIALGHADAPKDINPHVVHIAVENKAIREKDTELLRKLANSKRVDEATIAGQTLRVLRERDQTSPVAAMQQVAASRAKAVEGKMKTGVDKAVKETAREIKKSIKTPSTDDWKMFVESLRC